MSVLLHASEKDFEWGSWKHGGCGTYNGGASVDYALICIPLDTVLALMLDAGLVRAISCFAGSWFSSLAPETAAVLMSLLMESRESTSRSKKSPEGQIQCYRLIYIYQNPRVVNDISPEPSY